MVLNFENSGKYFESFGTKLFDSTREVLSSYLFNLRESILPITENPNIVDKSVESDVFNDNKKATYYNIKRIHDDLIASNLNRSKINPDTKSFSINKIPVETILNDSLFYNSILNGKLCDNPTVNGGDTAKTKDYDLYQIFQIVDRGNNHIGNKVLADLTYLNDVLSSTFKGGQTDLNLAKLSEQTIISLISQLSNANGFLLQQIPNYINVNGSLTSNSNLNQSNVNDAVNQMFGINTTTRRLGEGVFNDQDIAFGGISGFPGYILQIGTTNSDPDNGLESIKNNFTNSFCLDIKIDEFNNVRPIITDRAPKEITESNNVSCFTIDFGKQNQQMFNSININTSQVANTEFSIKNTIEILNKSYSDGSTTSIFPILQNYSYSCEVSGLGNATIQPTNYFYLRNTPLYSGTYWITNVKHSIVPNNMTTRIQGIRQPIVSKNDVRKSLLEMFKASKERILRTNTELNKIISEDIPNTFGVIKKNGFKSEPYGTISQLITTSTNKFYEFDAQIIIGLYIVSVIGNQTDPAQYGMIAYLYNLAKEYTAPDSTHTDILKNMINAVIADANAKAKLGDTRYVNLSLSKLYKDYGDLYSVPGPLHNLLGDITTPTDFRNNILIPKDVEIFNISAVNITNSQPITNQKALVSLRSDVLLKTTVKEEKNIVGANMYLDPNTQYNTIDPYEPSSQFNFNIGLFDIFNTYDPNTKNIKTFDTKSLKINDTNSNVTYHGAYGTNKIAFFKQTKDVDLKNNQLFYIEPITAQDPIIESTNVENQANFNPESTKITNDPVLAQNQVKVKNLLKAAGLNKIQVAGIMGNIQKETMPKFDPKSTNIEDRNDFPSIGLIQWNGRYHPKEFTTDINVMFNNIGDTIEKQIDYLINKTDGYNSYLAITKNIEDPYRAGYEFARLVEKCFNCDKGFASYNSKNGNQYNTFQRSKFAVDFYNRFNDSSDDLFWG